MNLFKNFARTVAIAVLLAVAAPVFAGGSLLGAGAARADVVSKIAVQGNKRVETGTIVNYITIKVGKPYGPAQIDSSIKGLYKTGLFSDVGISRSGSTLIIIVVESPVVNRVLFEGNKKVKNNILLPLIDTKPRGILTEATLQADVKHISDYYAHLGRGGATVVPRVDHLDNNRVDVTFVISDGKRIGIKSISFVGNHAYSFGRYFEPTSQAVLMSGYLGSIGFGFPAALGAWAAAPDRPIVAITGDGGFGQYLADFTTAVKYDMNITHILLNNGELAKISAEQRSAEYAVWQTSLLNPDFSAFARDCGAYGRRVTDPADVHAAIAEALDHRGPAMVEVMTDPGSH